jgi:CheY-like chemotaxis protein
MGKLILIVDDDADDRIFFTEALLEIDKTMQCIPARNAMEALDILKNSRGRVPDYIFLDLNMPRVSGLQCLAQIKKSVDHRHIPVIIFTTSRQHADAEEAKKMGADLFLSKPAKYNELVEMLRFIIAQEWNMIKMI